MLYTLIGQPRLTVRHSEWAAVLTSGPLNLLLALLLDPYMKTLPPLHPQSPHVQPFLDARWEETSPIPPMSLSFSGQSTDVTNSDTHVPKWIQDGCSPFSHCMQRSKAQEDAPIQNTNMSLCRRSVAEWPAPPWTLAHTGACSLNPACELQVLVHLRRGGANTTVWSSTCAQQARLLGLACHSQYTVDHSEGISAAQCPLVLWSV